MRKSLLSIRSFCGYVAMVTAVVGRTKTGSANTCVENSFLDLISEYSIKDRDADHESRCHDTHDDQSCSVDDHLYSTILHWPLPAKQLLAESFPIDTETKNYVRKVKDALFSRTNTTPFEGSVSLVAWTEDVLIDLLDLSPVVTKTQEFVGVFSGNVPLMKSPPLTHRYGGHQFGYWAGQLGDGRAHMIGEYRNHKGERWEMQLKGSGKSPYSRQGDGRAILRSSVREFLASEAMHHLGIPTARCATLITSSDTVMRDLVYNGHISNEKTAIVLRLAPSWFRFGSIEMLARDGELNLLRNLLDFIIEMHFTEISVFDSNRYLQLFSTIVEQTARLIALWQAFGFAHGVCNTDNFSILSITIDYGPFRFMDHFEFELVPNLSDDEKRYSYERQPEIGYYNLEKLAESMATVLQPQERSVLLKILAGYTDLYQQVYIEEFRQKLGLIVGSETEDRELVEYLLKMMAQRKADFTLTFRQLGATSIADLEAGHVDRKHWALKMLLVHPKFHAWLKLYRERLEKYGITEDVRQKVMNHRNPRYVLRNWMAEAAIEAAKRNDFSVVQSLARILKKPFEEQEEAEHLGYADPPPQWASDIKISCSS